MFVPNVICIVSDVRSGSTLLQSLLGAHMDAVTVGELRRLETFIRKKGGDDLPGGDFWPRTIQRAGLDVFNLRTQRPPWRLLQAWEEFIGLIGISTRMTWLTRWLMPWGRRTSDHLGRLLKASAEQGQARIVIDSSKDVGHAIYLLHQRHVQVHLVFLLRDGRGTVWSKIRRTGLNPVRAVNHWRRVVCMMRLLSTAEAGKHSDWLTYENLCARPDGAIEPILSRLGASAVKRARVEEKEACMLGGSPSFRLNDSGNLSPDERWRDEMPVDVADIFERIGGRLNRRLGYH